MGITMNQSSVIIKSNKYGLIVILDDKLPFDELLQAVADKFQESTNFFQDAKMAITFRGRVLTKQQEKDMVSAIVNNSRIHILCVVDERKDDEEYYKNAVTTAMEELDRRDGQFYKAHSGQDRYWRQRQASLSLGMSIPEESLLPKAILSYLDPAGAMYMQAPAAIGNALSPHL